MQIALQCLPCFLNQAVALVEKLELSDETAATIVKKVIGEMQRFDEFPTTLAFSSHMHGIVKKETGLEDPYKVQKEAFNSLIKEFMPYFVKQISGLSRFETAVRLAVAGNVIDTGVKPDVGKHEIFETIERVGEARFAVDHTACLQEAVKDAKKILYVADNAGEIVFDKNLLSLFPKGKTTLAVRGAPIINDATRVDAESIGMGDFVEIVDTGNNLPGAVLSECGPEFMKAFDEADFVISKGQGNFEGLYGTTDKRIFYLMMVKCSLVSKLTGYKVGKFVVMDSNKSETCDFCKQEMDRA